MFLSDAVWCHKQEDHSNLSSFQMRMERVRNNDLGTMESNITQNIQSKEISSEAISLDDVSIRIKSADSARRLAEKYPEMVHRLYIEHVSSNIKAKINRKYIYTVIDRRVAHIADAIIIGLQGGYFKKMPWQSLVDGEGHDVSCLIVFQQGTSGSCRGEDILTSLRERQPDVETIVAVCICIDNDKNHSTKCVSCCPFELDKDILFEYHIYTKDRPHTCSTRVCIDIQSHIRKLITEEQSTGNRKRDLQDDTSKKTLYPTMN